MITAAPLPLAPAHEESPDVSGSASTPRMVRVGAAGPADAAPGPAGGGDPGLVRAVIWRALGRGRRGPVALAPLAPPLEGRSHRGLELGRFGSLRGPQQRDLLLECPEVRRP